MTNIPVIYFHSVAPYPYPEWVRNFLTFKLEYFYSFLQYLKRNNWDTVFLDEYYDFRKLGRNSKSKICCLTFDDGYLDNYQFVYPLLKEMGFKATLFVSPEFIDVKRTELSRKYPQAEWFSRNALNNLPGFINWAEIKEMQNSGVIDIQSHTMTHTKYFYSDELVGLHHPGADSLYPIGNIFPDQKPNYIGNKEFEKLIPYGYPFFREESAVIAKRVFINEDFNQQVEDELKTHNWKEDDSHKKAIDRILLLYQSFKDKNRIIEFIETDTEYESRVENELLQSKIILENELNKPIEYLCWPHGDNTEDLHKKALNFGYKLTTLGKCKSTKGFKDPTRIPVRIGLNYSNPVKILKWKTKLKGVSGIFPYHQVLKLGKFF
jgi:hypothetical protein